MEKIQVQNKKHFEVLNSEQFVQNAVKRFCANSPDKRPARYTEDEWVIRMDKKAKLLALPEPYVKEEIDAITGGIWTELKCPACQKSVKQLVKFTGEVHRCPECLGDVLAACITPIALSGMAILINTQQEMPKVPADEDLEDDIDFDFDEDDSDGAF